MSERTARRLTDDPQPMTVLETGHVLETGAWSDALKSVPSVSWRMHVTVDVKGEGTQEVDLESVSTATEGGTASMPTYQDLLRELDLSPHEVSVLVDGRPVPEDQPVESDHVTVLRLIKGG